MKTFLVISVVICVIVILVLTVILWLATPHNWPMTSGTITAKKVLVEGQSFVMVEGQPMNYLGQIQSINLDFDDSGHHLVVARCLIRWNPFNKLTVNNQWPVFYPLEGVKPGKYTVVYQTKEGEATAANFDVP
ncbi:MAG: hypothetical protein WCJ07_08815 [Verrucomicrobiota bacterium]